MRSELPNKMLLDQQEYFIVQKAYLGWSRLAYLLAFEVIGMLMLIYLTQEERRARRRLVLALLSGAAAQAVFWLFTYPANQVTADWTMQPPNWQELRAQWEYSHLAGAVFQVFALCWLTLGWTETARQSAFSQRR